MNPSPIEVLSALVTQSPVALSALPEVHGIYALRDHAAAIRYLGITGSLRMGFYKRIWGYHVGGNETNSHKFSRAYCTGRMWRDKERLGTVINGELQDARNARKARALRRYFCRRFCKATFVPIPREEAIGDYIAYLRALESLVKSLAPPEMRLWDGHSFHSHPEPIELVDEAIREGSLDRRSGFSHRDIAAFDSQAAIHKALTARR